MAVDFFFITHFCFWAFTQNIEVRGWVIILWIVVEFTSVRFMSELSFHDRRSRNFRHRRRSFSVPHSIVAGPLLIREIDYSKSVQRWHLLYSLYLLFWFVCVRAYQISVISTYISSYHPTDIVQQWLKFVSSTIRCQSLPRVWPTYSVEIFFFESVDKYGDGLFVDTSCSLLQLPK